MKQKVIKCLSIDTVIFGYEDADLKILLIKRKKDPEKGSWALPGGFVLEDENLDDSAQRILSELTGLQGIFMEQVKTYGNLERYPLTRVITVSYFALVKSLIYNLKPGALAAEAKWFSINDLPELPFDHSLIVRESLGVLQKKVRTEPIGFQLLNDKFSLTELQQLLETVLNIQMDKRNFRKKILKMKFLVPLKEKQEKVSHRAAQLYKLNPKMYQQLVKKGFNFDL